MTHRLLIVTPLFYGDASGASIYYQKLYKSLVEHGINTRVVSERVKNFPSWYYPLFPRRSGENKKGFKDYLYYATQNLLYAKLYFILKDFQPQTVLIHSSFFNFPGLFGICFRLLRYAYPHINWIADARDRLIGEAGAIHLKHFNSIIACSENVLNHLQQFSLGQAQLSVIPIIQEAFDNTNIPASTIVNKHAIPDKYILYVGAVKEEKNVHILIDTYTQYIRKKLPDYHLVIAGLIKTNNSTTIEKLSSMGVHYIGNITHEETISLISKAQLCVNLSPCEGMPRFSLESLSLQIPTVLPPNIPEFDKHCASNVCTSQDPAAISELCIRIINNRDLNHYPIHQHHEINIISKYLDII